MTFAVAANEKGEKVLTMSKEYIDREEALSAIKQAFEKGERPSLYIKSIPAADVVEVRHEWWEKHGSKWQCTGCKVLMSIDGTPQENLLYYCPNCGCKMDKEEEQ